MHKDIIRQGEKFLMKKYRVKRHELKYIGSTDCQIICEGAEVLQYNIIKPNHKYFGSTVGYRYGW